VHISDPVGQLPELVVRQHPGMGGMPAAVDVVDLDVADAQGRHRWPSSQPAIEVQSKSCFVM